ncbi:hypothetical protein L6R50_11810 [Myxococcota bacterium]|nr:hypothetical protein [Myxococcota bacterium]
MTRTVPALVLAVSVLLPPAAALAQSEGAPPAGPRVVYKPVTDIDIGEGASVDGVLQRPGVGSVIERRQREYPPIVRLRADFRAEIDASVSQVR